MLKALANSGVHIRNLSLIKIKMSVLRKVLQPHRELYPAHLSTLKSVFVDTSVICRHLQNTAHGHRKVKALGMLLEEAQNLQTLELNGDVSDGVQPRFLQWFRPSLPKLTTLSISGLPRTENNLTDILMAYRATLASLDLTCFELTERDCRQSMGS